MEITRNSDEIVITHTVTIKKTIEQIVNDIAVYTEEIKHHELEVAKALSKASNEQILLDGKREILNKLNQLLIVNG